MAAAVRSGGENPIRVEGRGDCALTGVKITTFVLGLIGLGVATLFHVQGWNAIVSYSLYAGGGVLVLGAGVMALVQRVREKRSEVSISAVGQATGASPVVAPEVDPVVTKIIPTEPPSLEENYKLLEEIYKGLMARNWEPSRKEGIKNMYEAATQSGERDQWTLYMMRVAIAATFLGLSINTFMNLGSSYPFEKDPLLMEEIILAHGKQLPFDENQLFLCQDSSRKIWPAFLECSLRLLAECRLTPEKLHLEFYEPFSDELVDQVDKAIRGSHSLKELCLATTKWELLGQMNKIVEALNASTVPTVRICHLKPGEEFPPALARALTNGVYPHFKVEKTNYLGAALLLKRQSID